MGGGKLTPAHFYLPSDGSLVLGLREARRVGAWPSVTTILSVLHSEALSRYLIRQTLMSALTLPRDGKESDESYVERIIRDSEEHRDNAAAWGTRMHALIAAWNLAATGADEPRVAPDQREALASYRRWYFEHVGLSLLVESTLLADGYAGTPDFVYHERGGGGRTGIVVVDVKTQGTRAGEPARFYETWPLQLAAYGAAYDHAKKPPAGTPFRLTSLVLSSTEAGRLEMKVWPKPLEYYYRVFRSALTLWCHAHDYWPGDPGS